MNEVEGVVGLGLLGSWGWGSGEERVADGSKADEEGAKIKKKFSQTREAIERIQLLVFWIGWESGLVKCGHCG